MRVKLLPVVVLLILAVNLSLHHYKVEPLESFSLRFNDINFALEDKEPSSDIVLVAIDEQSVNKYGRWPWDRTILAKGIDFLYEADVVLIDMIFSESTTKEQDNRLSQSISNLNNSVCGFFFRHNSTQIIDENAINNIIIEMGIDYSQGYYFGAPQAEPMIK